jgi:hypothetical protein
MEIRMDKRAILAGLALLALGVSVRAEIKVVTERNENPGPAFAFKTLPSPRRGDAAAKAILMLVHGQRDRNGGSISVLNDGRLPSGEDDPAANFFFAQGSEGGRIVMDLGSIIDIKQVNTYSWHANTRGPQVYKLYAADGSAKGFALEINRATAPEEAGWKFIAAVDSRPKTGEPGGQYGASIADSTGTIGKYRYLLLDVSATETQDPFGNTFYSEIDVIDAAAPVVAEAPLAPAERVVATTQSAASAEYQITIDYSDAPELKTWVEQKLQPALEDWYPKIVKALPSDGYSAPRRFSVIFRNDYRGVAATGGTRVVCAVDWFKRNLQGEAVGAVVHELVHVVQQYRGRGNPGWLVEGIADYVRWFKYERIPVGTRPRNPDRAKYTDSYRTTAGFLNYVVEKHDKDIIAKLNAAMRQGQYKPELWKQYTGKTVDELWDLYVATLK